MRRIKYYGIKLWLSRPPLPLFAQGEKDELFLGVHVRPCSDSKMACLELEDLARQYAEACLHILKKRYGDETQLEVIEYEASDRGKLLERIRRDSETVRKRITSGNFAPNKAS